MNSAKSKAATAKSKAATAAQWKPHSSTRAANKPKAPNDTKQKAAPINVIRAKATQPTAKASMMPKHKSAKVLLTPIRKHKADYSTPKPKASLQATTKASLLASPKAMPAPETPRRSLRTFMQTPKYAAHLAAHPTPGRGGLDAGTPRVRPSLPSGVMTPRLGPLATSTPKLGPRLAMVGGGALSTPRRSRRMEERTPNGQKFLHEPTVNEVETPKSKAKKVIVHKLKKSDVEFKTPKAKFNKSTTKSESEETPKSGKKTKEKQDAAEESMMEGEAACGKSHRIVACRNCQGEQILDYSVLY